MLKCIGYVVSSIESPPFAYTCFNLISLSLILAKRLIHLKTLQGNLGNLTTVNIF